MKIRIRNRNAAGNHHVRANRDALRRHQRSVGNVTIISNLNHGVFIRRQRSTPDRHVPPDTQPDQRVCIVMLEAKRGINHRIRPNNNVFGYLSGEPITRQRRARDKRIKQLGPRGSHHFFHFSLPFVRIVERRKNRHNFLLYLGGG